MAKGCVIIGVAKEALLSDINIASQPSTKVANSEPLRYNKKIRKNAESMGTPTRLHRDRVAEQAVSKCRRLGVPLAHKGQEVLSEPA
jgi:hypothetical protein